MFVFKHTLSSAKVRLCYVGSHSIHVIPVYTCIPVAIQNNQTLVMASMNGVSSQVGECKVKLGSANIKSGERFVACHRQREHGSCFQRNTPPPPGPKETEILFRWPVHFHTGMGQSLSTFSGKMSFLSMLSLSS